MAMDAREFTDAAENVSADDKAIIKEYLRHRVLTAGIKETTQKGIASYLVLFCRRVPLNRLTKQTLEEFISYVRSQYEPNSFNGILAVLKTFIRYLVQEKRYSKKLLKVIENVKKIQIESKIRASDLFTSDEIEQLITSAKYIRDKALFAVMAESAGRPVDIINARWKDVEISGNNGAITLSAKTKRNRRCPLNHSIPWLNLLKQETGIIDGDTPVFRNFRTGEALRYPALEWIFKEAMRNSGLSEKKRNATLYTLRHSRITKLIRDGVSESVVKKVAWGSLKTPMLETYAHLSDADIDAEILNIPRGEKRITEPLKKCAFCQSEIGRGMKYCPSCGAEEGVGTPALIRVQSENEELRTQLNTMQERLTAFEHHAQQQIDDAINNLVAAYVNGRVKAK